MPGRNPLRDLLRMIVLVGALLALTLDGGLLRAPVAAAPQTTLGRANTWAARNSAGQTYSGTWTAKEDPQSGGVTGSWTQLDAQGRITARGGWAAAKTPKGWSGSWRAQAVGRPAEYSGTWAASIDLPPETRLAELFTKAAESAISGTWQSGGQKGAWTIQAVK